MARRRQFADGERPLRAAGRTATADASTRAPRAGFDPGLLTGSTDDEILRSFLRLVRTWRGAGRHTALRLREADVAVLVSILGTDAAEIERRLVKATACTPTAARRCRRLLLASVAALSIGLTGTAAAGALSYAAIPPSPAPQHGAVAGLVSMVAPPVAQTLAPPVAETLAPPVGTEAIVAIPSLAIDLPVIEGGQSVIDQGVVAHYTAPGWEPPVAAGAQGTYWLAAHHASHGGPFEALPDVAIGAEVRVTTGSHTFVYTVTAKEVVGLLPGDEAVYGTNPAASVILLQTCLDNTRRVLVHGTLTATL